MTIPSINYAPPSVTVIANGPLSTISAGAPQKTVLMLGTAPQGPDYPILCSPSDALSIFGNPSNYASIGYSLPLGVRLASIQSQPTSNTSFQFLVCRAGVVRANTTISGTGTAASQVWTLVITGTPTGTFTLTFGPNTTAAITFSATGATLATNVQTALQALTNVGASNMTAACSNSATPWTVTITAAAALANLPLPAMSVSTITSGTAAVSTTTPGVSYTQIWQVLVSSAATGGTFSLQYGNAVASGLAYNISASALQTAVTASTFFGASNATVIPSPSTANAFWIIAAGSLANQQLATTLVLNASALTPTGSVGSSLFVVNFGLTTGTAFVLQGVGMYAGSAGGTTGTAGGYGLAVNVTGSGANVTGITIYDISNINNPVVKEQFLASTYNLSNNQFIANSINGANSYENPNSIVRVAGIGSGSVQATASGGSNVQLNNGTWVTPLSGGSDGLGASPTNDPNGTIPLLLNESLWTNADYVWAGWDYTQVIGPVMTHLETALAQNQYRKAILGPQAGTLYGTLSAGPYSYVAANQSDRVVCIGHDALFAVSPITGNQIILDGFYAAAAFAGLKACGPTQETTTKFPISGFTKVAIPQDLVGTTNFLSQSQLNALAQSGMLVFEQTLSDGLLRVRDAITTAPYAFTGGTGGVNGGVNVFSQFSARDIDDAWSLAMVYALTPMLGRVFPSQSILQQAFTLACTAQAAGLGSTIVDYSIVVNINPSTNQPTVLGNYVMPYPALHILVPTAFTLG